jgi:hypothetical protein
MDLPMEDRRRFARGILPRGCPEGRSELRAECLLEGLDPSVEITVRVQQAVERQLLDAQGEPVESLVVAGTRYASRREAAEHEVRIPSLPGRTARIETAGSKRVDLVEKGAVAGALSWRWGALHLTVEAWTEAIEPGVGCVRVSVANRLEFGDGTAEEAALRAFYATEVVMHTADGAFASVADPPPHLLAHSAACRNEGLWPVPVGEAGDRRTILASQLRLEDYPDAVPQARSIPFGRSRTRLAGIRNAA